MNNSTEDENQPCSSKTTQNSRKTKNVPSVRWTALLDIAFHNPNELLPFSEIIGPVRNYTSGSKNFVIFQVIFY